MLLSFRFANHRSFRDEQQLNLTPSYETGDNPVDVADQEAVPVVGIFGANASGKSNVISAFAYFRTMVRTSVRDSEPGVGPARDPFLFDPEIATEPSSYAIDLVLNGVRYTYGFSVDDVRIAEEWLYSFPLKRKRVVFERTGQSFTWGDESRKSRIRRLEELVSPTALFLSVAARFDVHDPGTGKSDETSASLRALYSWVQQRVRPIGPNPRSPGVLSLDFPKLVSSEESRLALVELLRGADVGIQGISVRRLAAEPGDPGDLYPGHQETLDKNTSDPELRTRRPEIFFQHRGAAGSVSLGIKDESSGTLRLLDLAGRVLPVLATGGLILADEIDASLHPLLSAALVRLFQSPETNARGAQLVFTSHDATLLGSIDGEDVLRRDEVWFTSKGDDGASEVFPLAEFKPRRQGENRLKRYLNGSYGAIPQLSMEIFEQAVTSRADSHAE